MVNTITRLRNINTFSIVSISRKKVSCSDGKTVAIISIIINIIIIIIQYDPDYFYCQ